VGVCVWLCLEVVTTTAGGAGDGYAVQGEGGLGTLGDTHLSC